jgi:protein TonB
VNFPSIARLLLHPIFIGMSSSALMHGAATGVILYLLLAIPQIWYVDIQQGEAIVIQAQMGSVAATQPEVVNEVDISVEPVPIEPPPAVAVDNTPVQDTLIPVPASLPVVRNGEYEPTDVPPQQKPPESPASVVQESKIPPREVAQTESQPAVAAKSLSRQVADVFRDSPNRVNVAAVAPSVAGAVDEMPRKLANNRIPYYPLEALRAGIEGRVVLRVQINANGRADKIAVETSSGFNGFDSSAIDAVRDWKFAPAKRGGVAVVHEVLVPVRFRINRG